MKQLPEAETYERGLAYWPYRTSLQKVLEKVVSSAPRDGTLLDIMCGPGYLLGEIAKKRGDLSLAGIDIDERYVEYARNMYPGCTVIKGDVLNDKPFVGVDVVICTGSIHHIPYAQQPDAIKNIASMVKRDGLVIISDCYVDDYANEPERQVAAAKLGYEYLVETIRNGAPKDVVEWTADILYNDVMMHEFKPCFRDREPILYDAFTSVMTFKTWPQAPIGGYGDYVHFCSGPK